MSTSVFVQVKGTGFRLDSRPYFFNGTNIWYAAILGSVLIPGGRDRLVRELDRIRKLGMTNIRLLGLSEDTGFIKSVRPMIVEAPGRYNEALLEGLDFCLAEMAKRGLRAVIYLTNFWQWSGGMCAWVQWAEGRKVKDPDATGDWSDMMRSSGSFYGNEKATGLHREAVRMLVERTNTITRRRYCEDPTIMSWQLSNEPRPGRDDDEGRANFPAFHSWIAKTAEFLHGIAPDQLVSTGSEGLAGCIQNEGCFIDEHSAPHVDYINFHLWIRNWGWWKVDQTKETYGPALEKALEYVRKHVEYAGRIGKPVTLEEFGADRDGMMRVPRTRTRVRDGFFKTIYAEIEKNAKTGSPLAGSNFWAWGGEGRPSRPDGAWQEGDPFTGDPYCEPQGMNSVYDCDSSTLRVIAGHSRRMNRLCR
jgi:mannan endo-1,4-beta-mannosidase